MNEIILIWALPLSAVVAAYLYLVIKHPKLWMGTFFVSLPFFFSISGKGISAFEIIVGGFHFLAVVTWCSWNLAKGKTLIRSWGDYLLVLFIVLVLGNSVIAYLNNVEPLHWASEYSLFLLILYYFPIREIYGNHQRNFSQLLVIFSLLNLLFMAVAIWDYYNRLQDGTMFAYQIQASRSVLFGPVFALVIIYCVPLFFHAKGFLRKFSLYLLFIISSLGLLQTFTRGLWVSTLVSFFIAMCFLSFRQNLSIVLGVVMMTFVIYLSAMIYNPRMTNITVRLVSNRFLASAEITGGDKSMDYRVIEAESAFRYLHGNYLSGNGMRSKFLRWNLIRQVHHQDSFIHFGVVSQIYKLGVPLTILFFVIMANALYKVVISVLRIRLLMQNGLYKAIAIGSFAVVPTFMSMLFMSGLMETRYGNVLVGFLLAIVAIVHNKSEELVKSAQS